MTDVPRESGESIFRRALGADFDRLHPQLQRRFGVSTDDGYACVGRGTMRRIRRGPWWTVPFLQIGRLRNILVADVGQDVPFTVENYPYRDPLGRETVTFVREYRVPGRRRPSRFDATMVLDAGRGTIVDYLGTHQHLAVDLDLQVEPDGSLLLRSGNQRFYEGLLGFRFPMLLSGRATLRERYDDEAQVFRIDLEVRNRLFGFLFGYDGQFTCDYPAATTAPERLLPVRHERRF
ncbi:DUF4166 domain-containing protein [Isoptericola halotolerans]|uniref:DUF4166 domain-containing protein n=1 Tax=Isoptericola halotolerans TaxID=300560 RepID=A0ABX2A319_9MICO|nr:DUF4166 domain-containing protein [Isoptericola halotolerans]NOV96303.1 hypothetical protein [Isoptericola halotolerans]